MRLLIVDDDPDIGQTLKTGLEAIGGHIAVCAESGPEALDVLAKARSPFDLILLDIQMPEISGIELCSEIRDSTGHTDTPIIMITAMSHMDFVDEAFRSGANDYITKPFNFPDVNRRIKDLIMLKNCATVNEVDKAFGASKDEHARNLERQAQGIIQKKNIERYLEPNEFDNLAKQMVDSNQLKTSAFAVKLTNHQEIQRYTSPKIFASILSKVAKELSDAMNEKNGFSTYRGGGVFICIQPSSDRIKISDIVKSLPSKIDSPLPGTCLEFISSEQIWKYLNSRVDTFMLMQEAASSLKSRNQETRSVRMPPLKFLRTHMQSGLERVFERKAFQELLHDFQDHDVSLRKSEPRRSD